MFNKPKPGDNLFQTFIQFRGKRNKKGQSEGDMIVIFFFMFYFKEYIFV